MTSTPRKTGPAEPDEGKGAAVRRLQDDPRAQLALARKNQGANPGAAAGAGSAKAGQESSKQGKKEKKVRW